MSVTASTMPESRVSGHCPDTFPVGLSGEDILRTGELGPGAGKARFPYEDLFPLLKDYALFSHALLMISGLNFDPARVYYSEQNVPDRERHVMFPASGPVFAGLPFPWDHVVFAVPLEHAPGLFKFLDNVTGFDPATGAYWDAAHQFLEHPFPANLFAVSSINRLWHWVADPKGGCYRAVLARGMPETIANLNYARKVMGKPLLGVQR